MCSPAAVAVARISTWSPKSGRKQEVEMTPQLTPMWLQQYLALNSSLGNELLALLIHYSRSECRHNISREATELKYLPTP